MTFATSKRARIAITAAAVTLAAAAPAHAGWMTGDSNPPLSRSVDVCTDGMTFDYATFLPSTIAHPATVTISGVVVSTDSRWAYANPNPPDPSTVIAAGNYTIPRRWFYVAPADAAGLRGDPTAPGWYEYSGRVRLTWPALAPNTVIQFAFRHGDGGPYWAGSHRSLTVGNCRLPQPVRSTQPPTVYVPGLTPTLVTVSPPLTFVLDPVTAIPPEPGAPPPPRTRTRP